VPKTLEIQGGRGVPRGPERSAGKREQGNLQLWERQKGIEVVKKEKSQRMVSRWVGKIESTFIKMGFWTIRKNL